MAIKSIWEINVTRRPVLEHCPITIVTFGDILPMDRIALPINHAYQADSTLKNKARILRGRDEVSTRFAITREKRFNHPDAASQAFLDTFREFSGLIDCEVRWSNANGSGWKAKGVLEGVTPELIAEKNKVVTAFSFELEEVEIF